jgi:hypothetical protein
LWCPSFTFKKLHCFSYFILVLCLDSSTLHSKKEFGNLLIRDHTSLQQALGEELCPGGQWRCHCVLAWFLWLWHRPWEKAVCNNLTQFTIL